MYAIILYHGSNIKAESKMFAPNRHDGLIERQKTRYTWISFQEYEINRFQRIFVYSLPLLKLLTDVYAPVHD